ncbi:MAG: radical SAM protein [Deltaproteobacteria bacterium]|nr:radical SAM protein [Deltaproteobacteria bacterium]
MRALIKIGHACNNACLFCHAADRTGDDSFERVVDKATRARALGVRTLVLSGGEPTLRSDLIAIADKLRELGMDLGLVTNARRLADPALRTALLERGLSYVYVSLHAPDSALHDRLVGSEGAFAQTLSALHALHGRVRDLHVNAVVTRDSLGVLRGMVDLCATMPRLTLKFTMPQPKGAALQNFDAVVPDLSEAAAAVLDAIRYGRQRVGAPALGHEGFPLCLLPGIEELQDNLRTHGFVGMSEVGEDGFAPIDDLLLTRPSCCDPCTLRPRCPGIYREYAARRGVRALRPRLDEAGAAPPSAPASVQASPLDDVAARERASHEKRCWVRLTYACNNGCLFCLDKETGRTDARDAAEIRRDIVEGRRRGSERLILSGGEPTTHPQFAEFVRVGKLAGYRWVQAVSNGRMFSYPQFLQRAIKAGLDELTVSMHGHTPELHDSLVGVDGAFAQASDGVRSAIASGRIVVNIDIVINGRNVEHLPAMIETFADWGVGEFDLLHIIPFGAAWKSRDAGLFYDLDAHAGAISRALECAHRRGVRVWLNRFPPEHAEGFESLIQDPHKLHDEIRGRAAEFDVWRDGGPPLPCREPGRCGRCYLRRLCDGFERAITTIATGKVPFAHATLPSGNPIPALEISELDVTTSDVDACGASLATWRVGALRVRIDKPSRLASHLGEDGTLWGIPLRALIVGSPQALSEALSLPGRFDIVVELDRTAAEGLVGASEWANRLVLRQPTYERLSEQHERDLDPTWWKALPFDVRLQGVARCLGGQALLPSEERIELDAIDAGGRIDMQRFTSSFIREQYFVKSLRCRSCAHDAQCRGMHVNWVRAHGFAPMRPIEAGSADGVAR